MTYSVTIRLNEDINHCLDEVAKIQNCSLHTLIKLAIERFVQEEKQEMEWFKNRVQAVELEKAEGGLISINKAIEMLRAK